MQNGIFHLRGTVKHYDWGGFSFIPSLLSVENNGDRPFAEYWLGIHPLGQSFVTLHGGEKKLSEISPRIPFLFKVLDVKDMLSIQVHPSKEGARAGFKQENDEDIPIDSPVRNYKDENHKPELVIALSDFWLLHGFKPEKELVFTLLNVVELRELLPVFNQGGYSGLYRHVMEMPQEEVNRILEPLLKNLEETYKEQKAGKGDEDFWVARAAKLFCRPDHIDRGIFSIYFFNLIHLKAGEAIFQDEGVPHAYLEGQNVEIMANSDNVLRGGLTNKHIALDELMKHIKCEPTFPKIITAENIGNSEYVYKVPVTDFSLTSIHLKENQELSYTATAEEIALLTEGHIYIRNKDVEIELKPGEPAALILSGSQLVLRSVSESILFRASAPKRV